MNTEHTELETNPSEIGIKDDPGAKSRPGPGDPSEPPLMDEENTPVKRGGAFLAFLAIVVSILALAVALWTWWQGQEEGSAAEERAIAEVARLENGQQDLSTKFNQLRSDIDTLASGDVRAEFEALQSRLESDRRQMAELEQWMREQQALSRSLQTAAESMQGRLRAAEAAVTGMSTRELDAGGELDLAEVDYLLRLANERLKLFADPVAADQALEVADMHLAALNNPMYLGVRQEIAAARQDLAGVELPVYLDIAARLDSLQAVIPSLAFLQDEPDAPAAAGEEEEGWWAGVKSAFSSLVTVRRSTEQENERISLEDKDYVRQRVWLQLEIAHLALMRHDQAAFRNALARVEETIAAWFDPSTDAFAEVSAGIGELMALEIEVEVPDITAPWSTLQLLRSSAPAPQPAVPADEAAEEVGAAGNEAG